jgi:hypothetical protein
MLPGTGCKLTKDFPLEFTLQRVLASGFFA